MLAKLKRVAYNLRADIEIFVIHFVKRDGIKAIMQLIEESQEVDEPEMTTAGCAMLATILGWPCGIDAIRKKCKKYFEKFFELSNEGEQTKKQVIRAFFNCANHLTDESFDPIMKASLSYSKETKT